MLKRKCPGCARKIDKKYRYCPWCGTSIKTFKEKEDYGMLGLDDNVEEKKINKQPQPFNPFSLPLGLEKMMGPLIKQLEKELSNLEKENPAMPRNIKITFGTPPNHQIQQNRQTKQPKQTLNQQNIISEEEAERRLNLEKKEAKSKVKRLSDKIIYEIEAPGIKNKKDISITKLEKGFEIKAYAKDACYTKTIPLQIEISNISIQNNKIIIEMKNE